ncbi:MAG: BON domain-containing protein [Bryobacteraceae bacterium]|nr:BON domain-containing protein [Bryobacteraceae bacterium]
MHAPAFSSSSAHFLKIEDAAKECLRNSPYRALRRIACECRQGTLVLKGRLATFYHKQLAQEAVARVQGIKRVINEIDVG